MTYMLKITIVTACGLLLFFNNTKAQDGTTVGERLANRSDELMEMSKIGQMYQSTDLMSYSISYDFADSANRSSILEHKAGQYGMYDNLFWGMIDSTNEYLQGQQYYVVVDHEMKNIYVYDKLNYARAINVPLLDSLFNEVALQDLFITRPGGNNKQLTIQYLPNNQYKQVELVYDSTTYLISSIAYYYNTSVFSQAWYNCMDTVTTLTVPATGVAMPSTITCASLIQTYQNFIAEFPNHTKGATVRLYVSTGTASNETESSRGSVAASSTGRENNELKELWVVPQSVSGVGRPSKDTLPMPPPPPRRLAALAVTGSWKDSVMSSQQLFEWYMNQHLAVQYTAAVYTDWLVNGCGYKLYQLPWTETAIVRQDTLQNIWNRFAAKYPSSQTNITETVSVPIIKGVRTDSRAPDSYFTENINAMTWTDNNAWYKTRHATTYDLSALPRNATIQSAYLNLYAFAPSFMYAPHYRNISQFPYMIIQPVKGLFIPGVTTVDIVPDNYSGAPAVNLPPTSTNQVSSSNSIDFWSNQDYPNQNVSSMISAMYNNLQTTGVNYPVQYKLNDETYVYKGFWFGGTQCSNAAKKPVLNVSYTASRCDVFTAFVNRALGTYLSSDQVKELFKFGGKLDINSDCTAATAGAGCDGDSGTPITGVTTITFTKADETTLDLNLFNESRFFYKAGDTFYPQIMYAGYTVIPVFTSGN